MFKLFNSAAPVATKELSRCAVNQTCHSIPAILHTLIKLQSCTLQNKVDNRVMIATKLPRQSI